MNFLTLYMDILGCCIGASAVGMVLILVPGVQSGVGTAAAAIGLIFVLALVRLFGKLAHRRTEAMLRLLNQECRAAEFVAECRKMLPQQSRKNRNYVQFNLVSGLLNLGKAAEAEEELKKVDLTVYKNRCEDLQLCVMYHYNAVYAALLAGNTDLAAERLGKMKEACAEPKLSQLQPGYQVILRQGETWLKMQRGDYRGAVKIFEEMFKLNKNSRLNQAAARCGLAAACEHTGKKEKAVEAYKWAAKNGGDSWYAVRAGEALQKLKASL